MNDIVYDLLKKAIEQKNSYMGDMIRLQVEFFHTVGRLTDDEHTELVDMINPKIEEELEEPVQGE